MTRNALLKIAWLFFLIGGAGHFSKRGMRGYAFDGVFGHAASWFDKTLGPKQ